jgi:hypothetical protein
VELASARPNERAGDADVLAHEHARFFRATFMATFMPTLAHELRYAGAPDASRTFGDRLEGGLKLRLEGGLKLRLVSQPAPVHSFVQTMVLPKQGANTTPMSK